jgi:hypothetical protein
MTYADSDVTALFRMAMRCRVIAESRGQWAGGGVFPLEAALHVITLVTGVVVDVARRREETESRLAP